MLFMTREASEVQSVVETMPRIAYVYKRYQISIVLLRRCVFRIRRRMIDEERKIFAGFYWLQHRHNIAGRNIDQRQTIIDVSKWVQTVLM